ncbi:TRI39 ligase, partial [Furnarius figulus]|nr:TRI39 ligase [Furnarius figulus]
PTEQLLAEASCPLCLGLFQGPVSVPCGHNFCRGCLERSWEGSGGSRSCPLCRAPAPQSSLRPSRELGSLASILGGLCPPVPTAGRLCQRHGQRLELFCREHQSPLCALCAPEHGAHGVVPVGEAAQEFKEEIQTSLQASKEQRQKYLESRKCGALYLDKTRSEGQRLAREFQGFRRFLEEQERLLLAQLGQLAGDMGRERDEALAKVNEELSHLETFMWEMEGKFQQPPSQFLQDIGGLLNSCERMKFNPPAEISSDLERRIQDFVQKNILVRGILRRCQDSLMFQLQEPAEVTLDPSTAHPNLLVSEDGKEARGQLVPRDVPDGPQRFNFEPCVLARRGFTSGCHFWDVQVGQGGVWALGVALESLPRKGPLSLGPKDGLWALEAFHSLTTPRANLRLSALPSRLRVLLDYDGGRVGFFGAEGDAPILLYTRVAFGGQRVLPWFKVGLGARLREVTRSPPPCESPLGWVGFGFPLRICP